MNNEKVAWCVKNEKGLMLECLHEQKMFCEIDKEVLDRTQHTKCRHLLTGANFGH